MKSVQTDKAPQAIGPYSQAIIANGFVFCSGQIGVNPQTKSLAEGIEAQTRQVMENLGSVLKEAGANWSQVIKTTIYLTDATDFAKVNEIYAEYLQDHRPARATVGVASLPKGKFAISPLIEIEAIALAFKN